MFGAVCTSPAVLCGVSGPSLRRVRLEGLGSWCPRQGGQPGGNGAKSRQRPGCALRENPNLVSLRLKLPAPSPPCSHKGNFVYGSVGGGGGPRLPAPSLSPGTGVTAWEPQPTVMITPVILDLSEPTLARRRVWDNQSVLCVTGPALSDPDQTFFLGNPSGWGR